MRLMQWNDDELLTINNLEVESETSEESQYAMQFSRMPRAKGSSGTQVYRSRQTGFSVGNLAPGSGETEGMRQLWTQKMGRQIGFASSATCPEKTSPVPARTWRLARILALGADGTLYVEALKVRGEGDDGQVQSKLFAFGDAE